MKIPKSILDSLVIPLAFIFFTVILLTNLLTKQEQHHSFLAQSFLQGKTYFVETPGSWADTAAYKGKYYWTQGPMPSVILLPFVFVWEKFDKFFYQSYLQLVFIALIFKNIMDIFTLRKYSKTDAFYLAYGFCFASSFIGVAILSWSWYFSQVLATLLIVLFLKEYLIRKNLLKLGLLGGILFATRAFASFIVLIPAIEIFLKQDKSKSRFMKLLTLLGPYAAFVFAMLVYNLIRFGNLFEQGYLFAINPDFHEKAKEYGVFSLIHIPGNLYYMLLNGPTTVLKDGLSKVLTYPYFKADHWGMSIFITSPYLLYLFFLRHNERISKIFFIVIAVIALPIVMFYGVGFRQFGYRYSLDFFPILYFLLFINYKKKFGKLGNGIKLVFVLSSLANLYLFLAGFS